MSRKRLATGRRAFLGSVALGAGALAAGVSAAEPRAAGREERLKILAALGETIVPSDPGDPGFRELESHGITEEVNKMLRPLKDAVFVKFNEASRPFFQNRTFVELTESERADFLKKVAAGTEITDPSVRRVYKFSRLTVLRVFYANFPEHKIARDAQGIPILKPGDGEAHQITVPNTKALVTGWDVAGYRGPLTWEQEEQLRTAVQKVHWHDPTDLEALIVRYRPLPVSKERP
jgi:hypothetical protein